MKPLAPSWGFKIQDQKCNSLSPGNAMRIFSSIAVVLLFLLTTNGSAHTQKQTGTEKVKVVCNLDLSNPGKMSDIVSNALNRKFDKDSIKVRKFLDDAYTNDTFKTGKELAIAAAKAFEVGEAEMFAAIEEYRHCNCTHRGGEKYVGEPSSEEITPFAENVLFHVVLHEMAHGLVREFDLPILGNEETLADAFATHYLVTKVPDRALEVLKARVTSWMIEANELPRDQWTVKGEHNSDARRAYQVVAQALAHDHEKYASLAELVSMNDSDIRKATDYGTEIHRSWRRILKPLQMPEGQLTHEAHLVIDKESLFGKALTDGELVGELEKIVKSFDWHSSVKIAFLAGEGGAGWSRSQRTITVRDGYIRRFNAQAAIANKSQQVSEKNAAASTK